MSKDKIQELVQRDFLIAVFINAGQHHFGFFIVHLETHLVEHALDVSGVEIALALAVPILEDILNV